MSEPHYGETQTERLVRKARDAPFMVVGLTGLVGLVGYSLYGLKTRKQKLSVYLIHTRVLAQGCVVMCLTAGVAYNIYNTKIKPSLKGKEEEGK